jgi:hypothetical protein
VELFVIESKWRTSTVIGLCQSMRETQDYTALPILADALQDADCDNNKLLETLRKGPTGYGHDSVLVAAILLSDAAESFNYMKSLADSLGAPERYSYNEDEYNVGSPLTWIDLMETAHSVNGAEKYNWDHYIHMGTNEEYKSIFWGQEKEFWRHYQKLTGETVKNDDASSCSC